jgi:heme exporter protein CcmB
LWRSESLALSLSFGILVVLTFALATDPQGMKGEMISGVIWCGFAFSGIVNLTGSFRREKESGGIDLMKLAGLPSEAIYLGKMISGFVATAASNLIIGWFGGIMFGVDLNLSDILKLFAVAGLGTFGICTVGTLVAAISTELKSGESLLVALLMPLLFPIVISSARSFSLVLSGEGMGDRWLWLTLAYTGIFLTVSILLFEEVIE